MPRIRKIRWISYGCVVLCIFLQIYRQSLFMIQYDGPLPKSRSMVAEKEEDFHLEKLYLPTTKPLTDFMIPASSTLHSDPLRPNTTHHLSDSMAIQEAAGNNMNRSRLPDWFQEYLTWHRVTLQRIDKNNWNNYQYILLHCVKADNRCGGAADRLKMVPVMVRLAAQTQRLFFIHWSRPAPLEEFLVPSQLNWTLPSWLKNKIQADRIHPRWNFGQKGKVGLYNDTDQPVIRIIHILSTYDSNGYYNDHRESPDELSFWDVYHDLWHAIFQPSPPVQERIDVALRELDLLDGSSFKGIRPYVSVHVRSRYKKDTSETFEKENAIRCASHLQKELAAAVFGSAENITTTMIPIFVASDAEKVTQRAVEYGRTHNLRVTARRQVANPWHLDLAGENRPLRPYYDTFVDLYLLSLGQCYTWGRGGYGSWAAVIGHAARGYCHSSRTHYRNKCTLA